MATVNNRVGIPQAVAINGVDAGGAMQVRIDAGYDNVMRSAPDGLQPPLKDKEIQYVRGTIITQDWVEIINLLTGTVSTFVFYERKSGVAEATGFVKHTITAPVIHRVRFDFVKGQYCPVTADFECRPADETKDIDDMWTPQDEQAAPTYITAARGGFRLVSAVHGSTSIYHLTRFDFALTCQLVRECNDSDVGYTCVDARLDGMRAEGSISFQDSAISGAPATLLLQKLLAASPADLVVTVSQSQGAAAKVITIAKVDFNNIGRPSDVNTPFVEHTANYDIANDAGTPLTLTGTNKIITIT